MIVTPERQEYQDIAQGLADSLEKLTGTRPRIAPDSAAPPDSGPIIILGNLMHGKLARRLYLQAYDFTDYAWPSPGGHVLRTIRDPFGTGAHAVMLGGSDVAGVAAAAKVLLTILEHNGPSLGYLNRVKLGQWAPEIISYTETLLGDDDAVWKRSGVSGSWDYQIAIARAAIGYLRTGDEGYLPLFKRELRYWFDHDVYHPKGDAPQMLHGFLNQLIIAWDLVRDHPFFTEEERRRFDEDFLWVFCSREGPGRIDGASKRTIIRDNHGTRTALDAIFGGRYFRRRFGLPEGERWLQIADRYFAAQMSSSKPVEDSWGHQWAASLYNTLIYAMAAGKHEYFASDAFKQAADRALIAHQTAGAPQSYMAACAVAAEDTGYLSGHAGGEAMGKRCARMASHGDEYLRSFCTGDPIDQRGDLLGLAIAPLDQLWHDTIDGAGFNPGGLFVVTPPRESCFDKISIREGWGREDFYLLFDGISGGHHSYQDGNCIVRLHEAGVSWLTNAKSSTTSATVRTQNGVFLAFEGAGPGRLHRYARLLYSGQAGDYIAVGTAFEGVGEVDWQRHILRKRGEWTLVTDRATVKNPGEILAERHWHLRGKVTAQGDHLVSVQKYGDQQRCLHLQSAGIKPEGMTGTSHRVETVRAEATPQQPLDFATVLHVNEDADKPDVRLTKTSLGWRIDRPGTLEYVVAQIRGSDGLLVLSHDGIATFGAAPGEGPNTRLSASSKAEVSGPIAQSVAITAEPMPPDETLPLQPPCEPLSLPWREMRVGDEAVTAVTLAQDGRIAAGDTAGKVVVFAPDGNATSEVKLESPILSLHFLGEDLLVGEDRGALTRLGPDGAQRWQVAIPYVPMAWPYWSEQKSRVREITSAYLPPGPLPGREGENGRETILIANSDRRIYAFASDGKELWKSSVEWGVYTAMTAGEHGGRFALFGGTSRPSMHGWCIVYGADGKLLTHFTRPDLTSWSIPCQFRDMRLADVDGDGQPEIINAIDTNCRQLVVYKSDGKVLWDADMAGAAQAIAVDIPEGTAQDATVYCAGASGYVSAFDGATGARRWACFLGEPTELLAPHGQNRIIAIARSGRAYVLTRAGELLGRDDLAAPVAALLRPGDHRAGNGMLLGAEDGRVLLLRDVE